MEWNRHNGTGYTYTIGPIGTYISCFKLLSQTVVLSLLNSLKSHSPLDPVPLCLFHSISPYTSTHCVCYNMSTTKEVNFKNVII